tara:strand:+ start:1758 stop:2918 length:1161 start_codon:yes stop_codon:yes gene_type:complete
VIVVIGDIIIDEYVYGTSTRLSPEAPVPVVKHEKTERKLGGAGNVYNNIKSLTDDVTLIGYRNDTTDWPVELFCTHMPLKQRIYADKHYVTRIDREQTIDNSTLFDYVKKRVHNCTVVISDYNKGTIQDPQRLIKILKDNGCYVIVDPKQHLDLYAGADVIKPNKQEYEEYNNGVDTDMVVTLGADGYMINGTHYPTQQQDVYDVTGAGDTFLAVMSYFLDFGESLEFACEMANKGAGVSVQHNGVYVVHWKDLDPRPTVVFTNGCFDLLHRGHVEMLRASKALGEHLVVGLNTDASVKRLKGDTRPINNETDRKVVLESLDFVDEVILFDEDTPQQLIERIRPDIITKGGDYTIDTVVGNELAKVVIIPTVENQSTTNTIKRIVL